MFIGTPDENTGSSFKGRVVRVRQGVVRHGRRGGVFTTITLGLSAFPLPDANPVAAGIRYVHIDDYHQHDYHEEREVLDAEQPRNLLLPVLSFIFIMYNV
jgi:hypothetical protein